MSERFVVLDGRGIPYTRHYATSGRALDAAVSAFNPRVTELGKRATWLHMASVGFMVVDEFRQVDLYFGKAWECIRKGRPQ